MRTSTNYHFNLPELSDVADVTKLTANWESLDSTLRTFAIGLADVEDTVHQMNTSDLPAIRQSVTDVSEYAESVGESVTALDTEIHTTRPYMTTNTEQTVTAKKHIPTATVNDDSDVWVNKAFVQATLPGKPNNLVHDIGDERIDGIKTYVGTLTLERDQDDALVFYIDNRKFSRSEPVTTPMQGMMMIRDRDFLPLGFLQCVLFPNGHRTWQTTLFDAHGGEHNKVLFEIDATGNVIQ